MDWSRVDKRDVELDNKFIEKITVDQGMEGVIKRKEYEEFKWKCVSKLSPAHASDLDLNDFPPRIINRSVKRYIRLAIKELTDTEAEYIGIIRREIYGLFNDLADVLHQLSPTSPPGLIINALLQKYPPEEHEGRLEYMHSLLNKWDLTEFIYYGKLRDIITIMKFKDIIIEEFSMNDEIEQSYDILYSNLISNLLCTIFGIPWTQIEYEKMFHKLLDELKNILKSQPQQ